MRAVQVIARLCRGCGVIAALFALVPAAVWAEAQYVPGELLIKFKPQVASATRTEILDRVHAQPLRRFRSIDVYHVRIDGLQVEQAIRLLQSDPAVEYAEPNALGTV